jgi:hypothetical protein
LSTRSAAILSHKHTHTHVFIYICTYTYICIQVVNIGLPNEERRKKSGTREGDIQAIVEDMCSVGALDFVPALNTAHHLQQTASSLLQALGLLTGQGDSNRLLSGVMDVAVALYEQACDKGYTQV